MNNEILKLKQEIERLQNIALEQFELDYADGLHTYNKWNENRFTRRSIIIKILFF